MNKIILFLMTSLNALLFSCHTKEENGNHFPFRYIVDVRDEKDSLVYSEDLESGSYDVSSKRLVFFVEDGKDSLFYSSLLNFESYESLSIDKSLRDEIISLITELINPSYFNSNLKEGKKTLHLFIQSVHSNNKMLDEDSYIGAYFYYNNQLSEISQQLEHIYKIVQDIIKAAPSPERKYRVVKE